MVEYTYKLDLIFSSLADPTRRDILRRVARQERSIGELAKPYNKTFAAIAKHIQVLEDAKLVTKHRQGKQQMIRIVPRSFKLARDYFEDYKDMWDERFKTLDKLLTD